MVRPCKFRDIKFNPKHTYFKPRAIPLSLLEEVALGSDEIEAIRLADIDGSYHEEAAKKMKISRQTFDRILIQAHRTIADALINGKAILIKSTNVKTPVQCCSHKRRACK